jgi:hypothetical protein
MGLKPADETPAKTPLWLILLRWSSPPADPGAGPSAAEPECGPAGHGTRCCWSSTMAGRRRPTGRAAAAMPAKSSIRPTAPTGASCCHDRARVNRSNPRRSCAPADAQGRDQAWRRSPGRPTGRRRRSGSTVAHQPRHAPRVLSGRRARRSGRHGLALLETLRDLGPVRWCCPTMSIWPADRPGRGRSERPDRAGRAFSRPGRGAAGLGAGGRRGWPAARGGRGAFRRRPRHARCPCRCRASCATASAGSRSKARLRPAPPCWSTSNRAAVRSASPADGRRIAASPCSATPTIWNAR